jgi:hypothetical protein
MGGGGGGARAAAREHKQELWGSALNSGQCTQMRWLMVTAANWMAMPTSVMTTRHRACAAQEDRRRQYAAARAKQLAGRA